MRVLAFTVSFMLAFLMFAVQPMATKMVLPTLGGTPAVWNTVMFTFQLLLLLGYLYAHLLTKSLGSRGQFIFHGVLIVATFAFLPLSVSLTTSDALVNNPIPALVSAFLLQLGLPFFCLAATAPLLQSWVSRSSDPLSKTPYVLYSASNFGSFAGLLGYVALVEPLFDLTQQSREWSVLYMSGMMLLMFTGIRLKPVDKAASPRKGKKHIGWGERLTWVGLAFLPSSLSLGVTTYITTDIASIPLLWVIPLSIYLLSFVDAFRTHPSIVQLCQRIAPIMGLAALILYGVGGQGMAATFLFQLAAFAVLAFAIHGWLASRQPAAAHLTQFYVCLSVGGALGGVLNGLVAPVVFHSAIEYPMMLIVASVVAFVLLQRRDDAKVSTLRQFHMLAQVWLMVVALTAVIYVIMTGDAEQFDSQRVMHAAGIAAVITLIFYRTYVRAFYTCASIAIVLLFAMNIGVLNSTVLFKDRNFFGVMRVYENPKTNARYIAHDTTMHGLQSLDPKKAHTPMAYYSSLKEMVSRLAVTRNHPIAVVGLGAGTLKCLARPGQAVDLYEINPMSQDLAEQYFTYLSGCHGTSKILLGDGRIRIGEQPDKRYGMIIMDAFSSDAIPNHLLTQEAIQTYMDKLVPGGVLVFHTTNRHIDLWPLLAAQAKALDIKAYGKFYEIPKEQELLLSSFWVVMAKSPATLAPLVNTKGWEELKDEGARPWSDQYINLLPYFKALR